MTERPSLNDLGLRFGTDKASSVHGYLELYEPFLAARRDAPLKILEVGVLGGASLRTWEAYFPQASIIGADIVPASKRFQRGRITIELLDQSNLEELTQLGVRHGPFDLIVEDGSHFWEHQITTLRTLFPFVRDGGTYIVEDLQTNFGDLAAAYRGVASESCVEYLKRWVDLRVGHERVPISQVEDAFLRTYGRAAEFIMFFSHACMIRKRMTPVVREADAGQPLAAPGPEVVVTAHLGNHGDICGMAGYVNLPGEACTVQALELGVLDDAVEYRVRDDAGGWSDWVGAGMLGTRGQGRNLGGFAVRLRPETRGSYQLAAHGRFQGGGVVVAGDGDDCVGPAGAALCGLQVVLRRQG